MKKLLLCSAVIASSIFSINSYSQEYTGVCTPSSLAPITTVIKDRALKILAADSALSGPTISFRTVQLKPYTVETKTADQLVAGLDISILKNPTNQYSVKVNGQGTGSTCFASVKLIVKVSARKKSNYRERITSTTESVFKVPGILTKVKFKG